jgi:hypothetical protein
MQLPELVFLRGPRLFVPAENGKPTPLIELAWPARVLADLPEPVRSKVTQRVAAIRSGADFDADFESCNEFVRRHVPDFALRHPKERMRQAELTRELNEEEAHVQFGECSKDDFFLRGAIQMQTREEERGIFVAPDVGLKPEVRLVDSEPLAWMLARDAPRLYRWAWELQWQSQQNEGLERKLLDLCPRHVPLTIPNLVHKLELNSFVLGPTRRALFYWASFFNHSCTPNAEVRTCDDRLQVVTTRAIGPGQEVTISYLAGNAAFADDADVRRTFLLQHRHFFCTCAACRGTHHVSDQVRDDRRCVWCGSADKVLAHCVRCRVAHYCDRSCQVKHWKIHRRQCPSWRRTSRSHSPPGTARLATKVDDDHSACPAGT